MALPSGSRLHRAMLCPASAVLPRVESVSGAGEKGTAKHAFFANLQRMPREEALELVPVEHRTACEALDVSQLPIGAEWLAEVALVYDVASDSARFLGQDVGREYGQLGETELPMSLDLVGLFEGGALVVDFKTGRGKVPPVHVNWQLRIGAMAVARWKGLERVRVALAFPREDGTWGWSFAEHDSFDFFEMDGELRDFAASIKRPDAAERVRVGGHCRYCPSLAYCPAQTVMVRRMAAEPEKVGADIRSLLTPETAGRAYERLRAVKAVLREVESALHAYASQTPIPLSDGSTWGPVTTEREELSAEVAYRVLSELHDPDVAHGACDLEASKAGVKRALRAVFEKRKAAGEKVTLAALEREALDAIRRAGGVRPKSRTEFKEY
jgi:hypothetical protein